MSLATASALGSTALGVPILGHDQGLVPRGTRRGVWIDGICEAEGGIDIGSFIGCFCLKDVVSFELEEDVIFGEGTGWLGGDYGGVGRHDVIVIGKNY